ncbi:MAG: DUF89 family protein [Bacteroidetes bacterium]|nr:DUF89 family protein [Bacteroidota bacterium]MBU1720348.1 DUF89 family protein [Bacteroidota bacterium]
MKTNIDCFPCTINQAVRICNTLNIEDDVKYDLVIKVMDMLKEAKLEKSSPLLTKKVWDLIIDFIGIRDPYRDLKTFYNSEMMALENEMKYTIDRASDRLKASMKIAIAGNLIDFGVMQELTHSMIIEKIRKVEDGDLAIDHSQYLFDALKTAQSLLYIGDNCGEIVFDKMFIEQLKQEYPALKITFVVRGAPVINDVTREDALFVGMDKVAEIANTGENTPGIDFTQTSQEFNDLFNNSSVVISKGQGNFETLANVHRKDLYYLFMAKCHVVANSLGIKSFQYVCKRKNGQ